MRPTRLPRALPRDLSLHVLRQSAPRSPDVVVFSFTPGHHGPLTEAERDVAIAITQGLSNAEIARRRSGSSRTIANQVAAILRKLGISSRAELAAHFSPIDFL